MTGSEMNQKADVGSSDVGGTDPLNPGQHTFVPTQTDDSLCAICGDTEKTGNHVTNDGESDIDDSELAKAFTAGKRFDLAKKGHAMPDGSFPIQNEQDLKNAVAAHGRAKDPAAAKKHIKKRAAALGKTKMLPDAWMKEAAREAAEDRRAAFAKKYSTRLGSAELRDRMAERYGPPKTVEPQKAAVVEETKPVFPWPPTFAPTTISTPSWGGQTYTFTATDHTHMNGLLSQMTSSSLGAAPTNVTINLPAPHAPAITHERIAPVIKEAEPTPTPPAERAFVTEVGGKTLITGPASAFYLDRETALAGNEHFLWMNGRFVGAEKANRNNAFWTTGDLELGQASVKNGPLNWLHEGRHIIGSIADARLVTQAMASDEPLDQPYIEAASAIWKWIYPDEAWVVEQASEASKLWYSMECISKEVACAGADGCGATASYGDYIQGAAGVCDHMRERSGVRRFADPTFLGGAVIVPPVRPGWAEADAKVMSQAALLAEKAFDQAGHPDVPASEWEQLMAQVLKYGTGQ